MCLNFCITIPSAEGIRFICHFIIAFFWLILKHLCIYVNSKRTPNCCNVCHITQGWNPGSFVSAQQSTGACVFREPVTKEQSSELLHCVFKDNFSINNVREVLLSPVAFMQMQTLLRAAAHEWVLMIAFTETTKGRLCPQGAWNIDLGISLS